MEAGDGRQPSPSSVRRRWKRRRGTSELVEALPSASRVNEGKRLRLSAEDHSPTNKQSVTAGAWQWSHPPPSPVKRQSARKRKPRIIFSPEKTKVQRLNGDLIPTTPSHVSSAPSQPAHTQNSLLPTNQPLKAGEWQWTHPPPSPVKRQSARKRKPRIIYSPEKTKVRRLNDDLIPSAPSNVPATSQAVHTQNSLPSQLPAPPPPIPPTSKHSSDSRGGFYCKSCGGRFSSYNALEYHENLKKRALNKTKIAMERFSQNLHLLICPIPNCCFSSDDPANMKTHLIQHHRQKAFSYLDTEKRSLKNLYVIHKHTPDEGTFSCPTCLKVFNNRSNLLRHIKESCKGYGQHACVICARYFRDRAQMRAHMERVHKPPSGVRITGMFQGGRKERKGNRSEKSNAVSAREPLGQFTFLPDKPIVTSSDEFFCASITEGVIWVIQRARSSCGTTALRVGVNSLLRNMDKPDLVPIESEALIVRFTVDESPDSVLAR